MSTNELLFYIVILFANIIQGITGFAGTILAMPFSIMLVGYDTAKPILNVLGILSGLYVFVGNWKKVDWHTLVRITVLMGSGILIGITVKHFAVGYDDVMYLILGLFILGLAAEGLYRVFIHGQDSIYNVHIKVLEDGERIIHKGHEVANKELVKFHLSVGRVLVIFAGVIHGIFVCGGPVMVGYLTRRIHDREVFRATISTLWIILNTMILVSDISSDMWNLALLQKQLVSVPFLFGGMFIGGWLFKFMSQRVFMIITYILLIISAVSILMR